MADNTTHGNRPRPVVLCVLDGWGEREPAPDNAISVARTPVWDRLVADCPRARLNASAADVGLPDGQMGNSEVGHMNLGAGRIVLQDLPRIDKAIADGTLAAAEPLQRLIAALKESGGACHLMGLLSPGGVHSHRDHMVALAAVLSSAGIPVKVHAFLDGRDTPPESALGYVRRFEADTAGLGDVDIATVTGRYYAMDRDNRWDRVEKAYSAMAEAVGVRADGAAAAVEASYAAGVTDEFVRPAVIGDYDGMHDGDAVLMANFRADRARQILTALADPAFDSFDRPRVVRFAARLGMVAYSDRLTDWFDVLFPPLPLDNTLGEVVARAGLRQLRIAETEKYAHVTFFFNGGREDVYDNEDRILVPSPRVATYDLQPEMSAVEVTDRLVEAIEAGTYDLIVVNYANGDMVGHTGVLEAAVKACETVDTCLGRLKGALKAAGGTMLLTADHGNCERMSDGETGDTHTAHTLNPVPVLLVNPPQWVQGLDEGRLSDVAPTLLRLLGLPRPNEMTGRSLIRESGVRSAAAE